MHALALISFIIISLASNSVAADEPDPIDDTISIGQGETPWDSDARRPPFNALAVSPLGDILATRLDGPNVWLIDPTNNHTTTYATVPGVNATSGITKLADNIYLFGAGDYSARDGAFVTGSLRLWKLDLSSGSTNTEPQYVVRPPGPWTHAAIATWNETMALVAGDMRSAVIYSVNVEAGTLDVSIEDSYGVIHDINARDGLVYYTRGTSGELASHAVDDDLHADGKPKSWSQTIGTSLTSFDFAADGMIYAVSESFAVGIMEVEKTLAGAYSRFPLFSDCVALKLGKDRRGRETIFVSTQGVDAVSGRAGIATTRPQSR